MKAIVHGVRRAQKHAQHCNTTDVLCFCVAAGAATYRSAFGLPQRAGSTEATQGPKTLGPWATKSIRLDYFLNPKNPKFLCRLNGQ